MREIQLKIKISKPTTSVEKKCYGMTKVYRSRKKIEVWFNESLIKTKPQEFPDTFFHEFTHVFLGLFTRGIAGAVEERLCKWIGGYAKCHYEFLTSLNRRWVRSGRKLKDYGK